MSNEIMSNNILIPYLKDGKWGYCDKYKKMIIQNRFDKANYFTQYDLAIVELNNKKFLINKQGWSTTKYYDFISIENEKLAIVIDNSKYSVINLNGKQLLPWYDKIEIKENIDLLFSYINEDRFIFDFNGDTLLELNFKDINCNNKYSHPYFTINFENKHTYYITEYNSELFINDNEIKTAELCNIIYKYVDYTYLKENGNKTERYLIVMDSFINFYKSQATEIFNESNLILKKEKLSQQILNNLSVINILYKYLIFKTPINSKIKKARDLACEFEIEEHTSKDFDYDENFKETIQWGKIYTKQKFRLLGQQVDSHFNIAKHGHTYSHNFSMYAAEMLIDGEYIYNDYGEVLNRSTLIGFIDRNGKQITPYIFTKILSFDEEKNIAIAENKDGIYIISPNLAPYRYINNDTTFIRLIGEYLIIKIGDYTGVIDIHNNLIIPLIYNQIIDFNPETETFFVELNKIRFYVNINGEQFTDKEIKRNILNEIDNTTKFSKTLLTTYLKKINMYVIIDSNNNITSSLFEEIHLLNHNKSQVKYNGKFGLINEHGKLIVQCKYDKLVEVNENIIEAHINNTISYIDIHNNEFTSEVPLMAYTEIRLPHKTNNKWGFTDNNKIITIPCYYDYVEDFDDNELSIATFMSKKCLIDKNGVQRTSWYKSIERLDRNIYIVESGHGFWIIKGYEDKRLTVKPYSSINLIKTENNWYIINSRGCLNTNYEQKIGCIYSKIEYFNEKLFKVYKNKNWGYVNHEGIVCWEYIEPITDINDDDYDYQEHNNSNEISARDAFDDDEQYEDWLNQ